jgi:3-methyladenine DNA glycosylase AlkC
MNSHDCHCWLQVLEVRRLGQNGVRPAIPKWQKNMTEKTTNGFCNNAVDKVMKIDQDESKVKTAACILAKAYSIHTVE